MPKAFFTQGAVVLFETPVTVAELAESLRDYPIVRTRDAAAEGWMGAPGVMLPLRPEVNGYITVDSLPAPWPDGMGNLADEAGLFTAWSTGWLGPLTYPGCLQRARAMSFNWSGAEAAVAAHRAFVRIQSSYVLGASPDAPVMPTDYAAGPELELVTNVALAVTKLKGALAYFNPNGESLRSPEGFEADLERYRELELPPLPVWSNIRLIRLTEEWFMMDTVGMEQLDVDDHEACFRFHDFQAKEVDEFLRNATDYVRKSGPVIKDGDTMVGPGGVRWVARHVAESLMPRPRSVLRWLPEGATDLPEPLR
jgi:hypothetical protein